MEEKKKEPAKKETDKKTTEEREVVIESIEEDTTISDNKQSIAASVRKLEVAADPKRGPTEDYDPEEDLLEEDEDDDIVAIGNHRKYFGEDSYELLLVFKSKYLLWGTGENVYADIRTADKMKLLEDYLDKNNLSLADLGVKQTKKTEVKSEKKEMDDPLTNMQDRSFRLVVISAGGKSGIL